MKVYWADPAFVMIDNTGKEAVDDKGRIRIDD
jgi:hypothetical protein